MVTLTGNLISQQREASIAGYAIEVKLRSVLSTTDEPAEGGQLVTPVSASARVAADGRFQVQVDVDGQPKGPVEIVVSAPDGIVVDRRVVSMDRLERPLDIEIRARDLIQITPSTLPAVGQRLRVTGQVIDEHGRSVPSGLPVVIWGVGLSEIDRPEIAEASPARPLMVSDTQANGKFSGDWPTARLERAFGRVSGGSPVPVPLDNNNRLQRNLLLVVNVDEGIGGEAGEGNSEATETDLCECESVPPRSPDPIDLTENPTAFSQDLGSTCVDLTVPNRALEEFSYFKVVRTSEPKVKGVTLGIRQPVPRDLLVDLLGVSMAAAALRQGSIQSATLPTARIELDAKAARALVRGDRPPTVAQVERAAWLSELDYTRGLISAGLRKDPGRSVLDADNPIDWDDTPTIHLAIDIAHGHILRYREVWRADGYSLGDLLYSLPLAPGQRRKIAVVDWDRRSSSTQTERLEFEEELDALLSRDRDVMEIVGSNLQEETSAGSNNTTWGVAGGIGAGFIGSGFGIFGGVAGGGGGSSSSSWQRSARRFSADSQQQLRDRVAQRASSVRNQRSTVVQTVAQSETLRAETEVVANYNRCHAVTMEYFEVLRHFLITHELADVQECLFVPLPMEPFNRGKALRWREPLARYLEDRQLRVGFQSIERIADNWEGWDYPESRYSEESPETVTGELRIRFLLPRPRDDEDGQFQVDMWRPLAPFLRIDPLELFTARLNELTAQARDRVFRQEIAPEIAQNLVQQLRFAYVGIDGGETEVSLDATLVSRYREGSPLYVSLNPTGPLPNIPREAIAHFKVWYDGSVLPPDAQVIVHSGRVRYRTEHITALLFNHRRLLDDIGLGDPVVIPTPLSRYEQRNPREDDRDHADRLVAHLNAHLEYYHQAIWVSLDAQRRYMLLDAVLVPGLDGRSIASVCTNELIGIVGNSLVLPVAPGQRLDPTLDTTDEEGNPIDLINAYATSPTPPLRASVPTRGVYAEAVSGECNACELIDDSRYWRWTTEGQLALPEIEQASTDTRGSDEPDLTPTALPSPLVSIQNAPNVPDPFGLGAAFELLSKPELFRDITGLEGTQKNAAAAFEAALSAASAIGGEAAQLARQNELGRNAERMLNRIAGARKDGLLSQETAQSLANSALKGLIGDKPTKPEKPTEDSTIKKVLDKTAQSSKADIKVSTPDETVEISFDDDEPTIGAAVVPTTIELQQFINQDIVQERTTGLSAAVGARTMPTDRFDTMVALEALFSPGGVATLEGLGLAKKNPADPTKFQLSRRLQITHPAVAGRLTQVAGTGRLPVVVIVHGNHGVISGGTEIPNHKGYIYLQEALTKDNIVSVSVDTNMANLANSFIEMRAEYVLGALDALRAMDADKASRFHQRLDFDKVMLVGHSRGGDAVVRVAKLNAARPATTKFGIKVVCPLAPTDFSGTLVPAEVQSLEASHTSLLAVLYGALDGDVAGWEGATSLVGTGFRHYDRATCDKVQIFFDHCNHNRFNRTWSDDDFSMMPADVAPGGRLLARSDHEKLAIEYITALARWQLKGSSSDRGLFNGSKTNTVGAGLSRQYAFGGTVTPVDRLDNLLAPDLGTRATNNAAIENFPQIAIGGRTLDRETNHTTTVLAVNPNLPGPAPAAWEITLAPAEQDISVYDELIFSVSGLYDLTSQATINAGTHPDYTVVITDRAGVSSTFTSATLAVANAAPRYPVLHEVLHPPMRIISSSVANPTVITAPSAASLNTGDEVTISGHTGATPAINGRHRITRLTPTTFSIPVNVTAAGSGGQLRLIENCTVLRLETLTIQTAIVRLDPFGVDLTQVASIAIYPAAGVPSQIFFDALHLISF